MITISTWKYKAEVWGSAKQVNILSKLQITQSKILRKIINIKTANWNLHDKYTNFHSLNFLLSKTTCSAFFLLLVTKRN